MTKDASAQPITHSTTIELSEPVPAELPVGSALVLQIGVSCAAGCDLAGLPLTITGPGGEGTTIEPRSDHALAPQAAAPRAITLEAPQQVGQHVWSIRLPAHESAGV